MATMKTINYEGKFQNAYTIPFFGKIILCSNYEDSFINAKEEDIRYWIRRLPMPKDVNVNIEDDLQKEVPAFLYDLNQRLLSTKKASRMWFDPDEIVTEALENVRYQSRSWLYKEIEEYTINHFLQNEKMNEFYADPTDIKERWFNHNNDAKIAYIRKVLKNEYNYESDMLRYAPMGESVPLKKVARAFRFERDKFLNGNHVTEAEKAEEVEEIKTIENNEDEDYNL
jgi:hypothetical protein